MKKLIGTGKLEKPVNTQPLDELTVGIDWVGEESSGPIHLKSLTPQKEDEYKLQIQIYLNDNGKAIVNKLAGLNDFSEDIREAIGKNQFALGLIGISAFLPSNKASKVLLVVSLTILPFTRMKIEGKIRASPILRLHCSKCGFQDQFNPETKEKYSKLTSSCPSCKASEQDLDHFLIK